MIIDSLDIIIPFSKRHPNETIRNIIRYDSGYLKDLFIHNESICFSEDCLVEICRLTKGFRDNWETSKNPSVSIFDKLKSYGTPYPFDFNDPNILQINKERLNKTK